MAANPRFRYFYVIWAFLECLLFGGLLYGWASLVFILKEDGVYSELCDGHPEPQNSTSAPVSVELSTVQSLNYSIIGNSSQTASAAAEDVKKLNLNCPARDKKLALVFTIASMAFCAGCAGMGQINYKFGTRVTRICALVVFTAGALLTGFTSQEVPWLIFIGLSMLGFGGIPLLMTNTQFSMLFSKGSSTVVSMLSGAFDASSGVILIVKLVYEAGIALRWSMVVITGLHFLTLINTLFFLPWGFITKTTTEPVGEDALTNEAGAELLGKTNPRADQNAKGGEAEKEALKEGAKEKELPSVKSCILSPVYILHVIWLSILQLRFYYFLGSLNPWLFALLGSNKEVSFYTNVCQYAMMCGLITSPVAGIIYDVHKRIFADSRSKLRRDLMPAVIPLAMTSFFGITLSALVLVNNRTILYPAFIFNTIFRSFIYSIGASYIGVMFPSEYFGILYGLMIILSGVICLAQYGLFSWAEAAGFASVDGFMIAFMAVSLVHPLYQWFSCRRAESQVTIEER